MQYGADQLARAMLVIQYILRAKNLGVDHEPIWNLVITSHIARYLAPPFPGQYPIIITIALLYSK